MRTSELGAVIITFVQMLKQGLKKLTCPEFPSQKIPKYEADLSDVNNRVLALYCVASHCALLTYSVPGTVLEKSSFVGRF